MNLSSEFPTRSDTNRTVQPKNTAKGLKFRMQKVEGLNFLCSKYQRERNTADLRLCLRLCKKQVFSWHGSNMTISICLNYYYTF